MTSIRTTTRAVITRKYDDVTYTPEALASAKSNLLNHLSEHRIAVNAFIRQQYFADATAKNPISTMNETLASMAREGFTSEIINLYSLTCKYFGGSLPPQSELDSLDAFSLKKPARAKDKKSVAYGVKALIESLQKRADKLNKMDKLPDGGADELKAIGNCLALLRESKKA